MQASQRASEHSLDEISREMNTEGNISRQLKMYQWGREAPTCNSTVMRRVVNSQCYCSIVLAHSCILHSTISECCGFSNFSSLQSWNATTSIPLIITDNVSNIWAQFKFSYWPFGNCISSKVSLSNQKVSVTGSVIVFRWQVKNITVSLIFNFHILLLQS
jgi:hypothetical protein